MKISDRALGYLSLLVLICIFTSVAIGMWSAHHEMSTEATVDFQELGSLQPEDPVTIRGYRVGSVGKVKWLGDRARVKIKFNEPIVLREGTQFNDVNYALMGQRRIEIVPSKTGKVCEDSYIFTGRFEPGIAEALRLVEQVNSILVDVRNTVILITEGDSTHPSAPEVFESTLQTVEGILDNADKTVRSLAPKINSLLGEVNSASSTLIGITHQADSAVKVVTQTAQEKLTSIDNAIKTINDGAAKANQIITDIETSSVAEKLLSSKETLTKINKIIDNMNQLVKAIDTKGIKVLDENGNPVKLITWKNMNIIGATAREKAAQRAKEGKSLE
ncbi:MAG: MCE family protein [Fibrobacteraceae bacterium]|nr:MCE family protein [Fibrobacteraceae bacterium]